MKFRPSPETRRRLAVFAKAIEPLIPLTRNWNDEIWDVPDDTVKRARECFPDIEDFDELLIRILDHIPYDINTGKKLPS